MKCVMLVGGYGRFEGPRGQAKQVIYKRGDLVELEAAPAAKMLAAGRVRKATPAEVLAWSNASKAGKEPLKLPAAASGATGESAVEGVA